MQGGLRLVAMSLFLLLTAAYLPCKAIDTQDDYENHLIDKIQVNHAGELSQDLGYDRVEIITASRATV